MSLRPHDLIGLILCGGHFNSPLFEAAAIPNEFEAQLFRVNFHLLFYFLVLHLVVAAIPDFPFFFLFIETALFTGSKETGV
jgi:hypothetical protein